MTNRQLRQYEMLVRVGGFGNAHRDRFPETVLAGPAFTTVADAVKLLRDRAMAQLTVKQEGSLARRAARVALLAMLEAISRTARVIQADTPTLPNTLRLPARKSAQALLTAARVFARDVEPGVNGFIAHGMPATFVADLTKALDTYDEAVRRREVGMVEGAGARAGIDEAIEAAIAAARRLDVIVANHLHDDATAVGEWERARKIPYTRRDAAPTSGSTSEPASGPAAPAPPAPPPAISPPAVGERPPVSESKLDAATPDTTTSTPPGGVEAA